MLKIYEAKGIAEPSLIFVDFILREFRLELQKFIKYDEKEIDKVKDYDKKDLSILTSNWYWKDFPVSSMQIKFLIKRLEEKEFIGVFSISEKMFITGGGCFGIGPEEDGGSYIITDEWGDKSLHLSLFLDLSIKGDFSDIEKMMIEIESCTLHELNHGYEFWKRYERNKGFISLALTSSIDLETKRVIKDVFENWNRNFSFYLYWSEEHEIRAMVQDSLPYVKKYRVEDMKKECPSWSASNEMIEFDSKKFKSEISNLIRYKYGSKAKPDLLLNRLKNSLANELIKEREVSKTLKIDKPSILGEKIKSMDLDKFLEFSQRRINSAGEKLRRRILRLYSLKNKDTDEIIF